MGGGAMEDMIRRFAQMLGARRPTGQKISEHEAKLAEIHRSRGNKTDELPRRETINETPLHPECAGGERVWINGPSRNRNTPAAAWNLRNNSGEKTNEPVREACFRLGTFDSPDWGINSPPFAPGCGEQSSLT
jgi:hypothetical protein